MSQCGATSDRRTRQNSTNIILFRTCNPGICSLFVPKHTSEGGKGHAAFRQAAVGRRPQRNRHREHIQGRRCALTRITGKRERTPPPGRPGGPLLLCGDRGEGSEGACRPAGCGRAQAAWSRLRNGPRRVHTAGPVSYGACFEALLRNAPQHDDTKNVILRCSAQRSLEGWRPSAWPAACNRAGSCRCRSAAAARSSGAGLPASLSTARSSPPCGRGRRAR
jgi:hypothetical protein